MKKITLTARLRYQFDNIMARGPIALIGVLFLLSAILVVVISVIVFAAGIGPAEVDGAPTTIWSMMWFSLMRALDSGAIGGDQGSWLFLLLMFLMTLGGIFIVSILIGILTSGIESQLSEIRKGRSFVVEQQHTIILGWSPQIFSIISELVLANASQKYSCIAILAPKDKVEMEDEIANRIEKTGRTRIVCRTGDPVDLNDLRIINPNASRAIIVLAPENENPDAYVIKTILAITNNPARRAEPYHIVAEVRDPINLEVARMVGRSEAQLLLVSDLIARITVQTSLHSGLSAVYTELLDFGGNEIYFHAEPTLTGKSFRDVLLAYSDSTPIGIATANGKVSLKPPLNQAMGSGDKLIVIAEDDSTIRLAETGTIKADERTIKLITPQPPTPWRTLILGWNQRAPIVLRELDSYSVVGSEVTVVADMAAAAEWAATHADMAHNQRMTFQHGDTTDRRVLDALNIPSYNHVIVLSYCDQLETQAADSRTLITLLHLRDIGERHGGHFSVVSEMLDLRNRELAEVTHADDFIVSEKLVSLMLSQIAENRQLTEVFADLFDPEGAEIYLKPMGNYIQMGTPVTFATVVEAAARCGEIAIGYRLRSEANDTAHAYGIHINPTKTHAVTFTTDDRLIVLADQG